MDRTLQPDIKPLDKLTLLAPQRFVLPNGIPLTVIDAGDQEVTRVDILFEGGRWRQDQKFQGLFTSRMLREGTSTFASSEISEKLDYYGAWLELSASARHDYVTFYSLNKYFDKVLEVVDSIIKEPLFPEKELEIVKDANIQQFKVNLQKVDYLAQRELFKALYGDKHPCGLIADEDDYRAITTDVLRRYYDKFYNNTGCALFISGKVDEGMIEQLTNRFGIHPFGKATTATVLPSFAIQVTPEKRIFIERPDSHQSAIKMGLHIMDRTHPDFLKFKVLVTLFGGYFGSRLMTNIREDKGYTYGISAGIVKYPDSNLMLIAADADCSYVEPLIAEVYNEIDRLHNEKVSEEELSVVKNYMVGEICRGYESPFSLSDAWIFNYSFGESDDYYERVLEAIQTATPDDMQRLARLYLCKDQLKEVIAGKK